MNTNAIILKSGLKKEAADLERKVREQHITYHFFKAQAVRHPFFKTYPFRT
ncbi:hypothetical protein M1N51_01735 [Peptococcaceae bacterium]|nr:hypothetical protein [Peptococcaceae bacterium]